MVCLCDIKSCVVRVFFFFFLRIKKSYSSVKMDHGERYWVGIDWLDYNHGNKPSGSKIFW
jgi:hypothetical protein